MTMTLDKFGTGAFGLRAESILFVKKGRGRSRALLYLSEVTDLEVHATHSAAGHCRRGSLLGQLGDHGLGRHQQTGD